MQTFVIAAGGPGGEEVETKDSLGLGDLEKYAQVDETPPTEFVKKVDTILGAIQMGGTVISVICLIILGAKYMIGSTEQKAEYKKTLMPYVLGAVMVLGIGNVIRLVYKAATGLF